MPYEAFKKCCVDANYTLLGNAPADVLETQWLKLFSEFCVISGDDITKVFAEEYAEVCILESKILAVKIFCSMLINGYSRYATDHLRKLGYPYPFTAKSFVSDMERVIRKLKNDEVKMSMLLKSIDAKQQGGDTEKQTYAMFDSRISEIERAFKVPINTNNLSTQMYAIKLKEYKQYISDNQNTDQ